MNSTRWHLANRYASWMQQYYDTLDAEADVPCIMMHDDIVWSSGPIFRPAWYREYVSQLPKYLAPKLSRAEKRSCTRPTATLNEFIDDIANAGVHGFVFEPLTSLETIVERYGQTHVIIGNADTRILLFGARTISTPKSSAACPWAAIAPASSWPSATACQPDTQVENALFYNEVYEELARR